MSNLFNWRAWVWAFRRLREERQAEGLRVWEMCNRLGHDWLQFDRGKYQVCVRCGAEVNRSV